jgi:hypothetical protein
MLFPVSFQRSVRWAIENCARLQLEIGNARGIRPFGRWRWRCALSRMNVQACWRLPSGIQSSTHRNGAARVSCSEAPPLRAFESAGLCREQAMEGASDIARTGARVRAARNVAIFPGRCGLRRELRRRCRCLYSRTGCTSVRSSSAARACIASSLTPGQVIGSATLASASPNTSSNACRSATSRSAIVTGSPRSTRLVTP